MPERPHVPEYDFAPATPSEPYWKNEVLICFYYSVVGLKLGYVKAGEGSARHLWFGYIGDDTDPVTPGGRSDREEAKSDVVRMTEIAIDLCMTEMEFRAEQRRNG